MEIGTIVFWVVIIGLAFFIVGIYNKLVALRNRFKNAFSQIDVQLTRRYELIPNLVETAKAYMAHEKDTLEAVIQKPCSVSSQVFSSLYGSKYVHVISYLAYSNSKRVTLPGPSGS